MQPKQKKAKRQIKVQDLKPKKDAKGGVVADVNANVTTNVSTHRSTSNHRTNLKI
jgi:hypothetical protein